MTRYPLRPSDRMIATALPRPASVTRMVGAPPFPLAMCPLPVVKFHDGAAHVTHDRFEVAIGVNDHEVPDRAPETQVVAPPRLQQRNRELALAPERHFARRIQADHQVGLPDQVAQHEAVDPALPGEVAAAGQDVGMVVVVDEMAIEQHEVPPPDVMQGHQLATPFLEQPVDEPEGLPGGVEHDARGPTEGWGGGGAAWRSSCLPPLAGAPPTG